MAQVINTNTMSLDAQRNLNKTSEGLSTTIQRLSTGMRINSAKDDAAGLSISTRFTSQINGTDQASRNANDGISLTQTAEGALGQITDNLQRIRELSVQAANATNSDSDKKTLQAESSQLLKEIDRVASQTNFNGKNLLDGSFSGSLFQVGSQAGQTIQINGLSNNQTNSLGRTSFSQDGSLDLSGLTSGVSNGQASEDLKVSGLQLSITGSDGTTKSVGIDSFNVQAGQNFGDQTAAAINSKLGDSGVYASNNNGKITLSSVQGNQTFSLSAGSYAGTASGSTASGNTAAVSQTSMGNANHLNSIDISSFTGASRAIGIIDNALNSVSSSRADMGAVQNRFTATINNLNTTSENLSASRSRIMDTDYAKETANLTRQQILQKAGTSMLAQANASTQNVLSLLGN